MGTGAAEGIPAFWADTFVSNYARKHRGKDVRTRSAALIDDCLKIDLGPDTLMQTHRDELDPCLWTAVFFTHSDDDHFAPAELQYGLFPFNNRENLSYTIFGNGSICDTLKARYPQWPMEIVRTTSFRPVKHGRYCITPIKARHKPEEDSHNFIFDDGEKTLLYATDTGIWEAETWAFLESVRLDGLILECTEGISGTGYDGHLDLNEFESVIERLRTMETVGPKTTICTTHHSHNGGATHAMLEERLNPQGVLVGYDGLVLEI